VLAAIYFFLTLGISRRKLVKPLFNAKIIFYFFLDKNIFIMYNVINTFQQGILRLVYKPPCRAWQYRRGYCRHSFINII